MWKKYKKILIFSVIILPFNLIARSPGAINYFMSLDLTEEEKKQMKEFKEVVGIERDEIQFRDDLD